MRKLHEPLERHIHDDLCSSVNQAKIHHISIEDQSAEQQAKIIETRKRTHEPAWSEIIELITHSYYFYT
jgi:hypothetical protein